MTDAYPPLSNAPNNEYLLVAFDVQKAACLLCCTAICGWKMCRASSAELGQFVRRHARMVWTLENHDQVIRLLQLRVLSKEFV